MEVILVLILVALVLFTFEIVVPGGLLFLMATVLLLIAVTLTYFQFGLVSAAWVFAGSALVAVTMVIVEIRVLPNSPLGRLFTHKSEVKGGSLEAVAESEIVGKKGEVLTTLTPGGKVMIEGAVYEGSSESGHLEKGTPVEVVASRPFHLVVRKR